jgi:hypothetical protein
MRGTVLALTAVLACALPLAAAAQDAATPIDEAVREQSCKSLQGGTAGAPDQVPAEPPGPGTVPATWPEAPAGLLPERVFLRTPAASFNRRYEFATRDGSVYVRGRDAGGAWRALPVPACFAGRVAGLSVDDDELIAVDTSRRVFTMDSALKDASLFNWTARWGTPFWLGTGLQLPDGVAAWSWSVVSPLEDQTWTDPAGNRTAIGAGKVSHIWGLRTGGQRLTFWDPWLAVDESYEMCGPHRGRFRAVNLSASGSFVFVVGRHGDLFTRLYDFDISGHDPVFFSYSYDDQRGRGDGSPIQLPAADWVEQPKIPGTITSAISIHKVGTGTIHRVLRVEGVRDGRTGYWERDAAAPGSEGWSFHATGVPAQGAPLDTPRGDTSARGLGPGEDVHYRLEGDGVAAELIDFNVYCSPARLVVRQGGRVRELRLHHVDGLRQQARGRGLDDTPRAQSGAIEDEAGKFTPVTVQATTSEVVVEEQGWRFKRVGRAADPPAVADEPRCLPRRLGISSRGVRPPRVRPPRVSPPTLGTTRRRLARRIPRPVVRSARSWRWCVEGGGRVMATFSGRGRVALVATTASGHRARGGLHPGGRSRGRGLVRAGRRSRLLYGVRRGRVSFLAVASTRTIAGRSLATHLRRAGLRP